MKQLTRIMTNALAVGGLCMWMQGAVFAQSEPSSKNLEQNSAPAQNLQDVHGASSLLTVTGPNGQFAHVFPTVNLATMLGLVGKHHPSPLPKLIYHAGGSVMQPNVLFYVIYWIPSQLQNGSSTSLDSTYQAVENAMVGGYGGHSISANNTQYYQIINTKGTYINGNGNRVASYVDKNPYPASNCTDTDTPENCITDAQVQTEIARVMGVNGWTGGMNKMYLLFTSSGEGSCFDSGSTECAYTYYCAYHSSFGSPSVIYGNEPYGDPNTCNSVTVFPTRADADTAATAASHEISEAITDPLGNAWYDSSGSEIGDKCAYNYGTNTWDSGKANQNWGLFLEVQQEFDNHANLGIGGCVQYGP